MLLFYESQVFPYRTSRRQDLPVTVLLIVKRAGKRLREPVHSLNCAPEGFMSVTVHLIFAKEFRDLIGKGESKAL